MGLSRTGSEACLVYTVLGTLGRRAGPPSSAGRLFVVSIRRSCTSDPAWYMMVSKRVSNESIRFLSRSNRTKMPGVRRRRKSSTHPDRTTHRHRNTCQHELDPERDRIL
jgi:hypothetical protein